MSEFGDKFGDIARGLLSLEVNTIIKANMTASSMPSDPLEALGQIAADYRGWLAARGVGPAALASPPTAQDFDALGKLALALRNTAGTTSSHGILAQRIVSNCTRLVGLFDALTRTNPRPSPSEIVQLRKIWEIGTEQIAFQTVLWIDGDVTHRVLPEYAGADATHLLAVHGLAVKNAITMWQSLANVLKSIFDSVWSLVTK